MAQRAEKTKGKKGYVTVRATKLGFYNNRRQRPGVVFRMRAQDWAPVDTEGKALKNLQTGEDYHPTWAEIVSDAAPVVTEAPEEAAQDVDADAGEMKSVI